MVPEPRSADHELTSTTTDWMNAGGHMSLRVRRPGLHTVVVEATGEIDLGTARRLDEVLQSRIRSQVDEVVIDLSGVTFFSVAGLNSLLRAQLLADAAGAHLTVDAGQSRAVRRLFALLPVDFDGVANARPVR
jgi:anti-anti-sigma factor